MSIELAILCAVVVLAYAVQTAAGFGATVIAVTIGAFWMPIPALVPLLVPLSLTQTLWIGLRHRDQVARAYLLSRVLPLMGTGMAAGFIALPWLGSDTLKLAFGLMILLLSIQELAATRRGRLSGAGSAITEVIALLSAGIIHGIFATGGPMLVYAASRRGLDRGTFRSTLIVAWLPLNTVLLLQLILSDRLTGVQVPTIAVLMLMLPLGVWLGERAHERLDEARFRQGVFALLGAAGLAMVVPLLLALR